MRKSIGSLFVFFCFLWLAPSVQAAQTLVSTPSGKIVGVENDGISVFKGIPYAKPPLGDLRFAPPQKMEPWTKPLEALHYGPTAVQISAREGLPMSEDCLTLNIWTPSKNGNKDNLPVYVYIHGGGYANGTGSEARYDGTSFARNGIVSVSINYRLNAMGFFASRATFDLYGTTGNWGLLDQIMALKWIRDNIEAFGGGPENVTIGGESAGSWSVSALILSPMAKGLFQGAIMESGSILGAPFASYYARGDLQRSMELGGILSSLFNADDSAEGLAKLRKADSRVLAQFTEFGVNQTRPVPFFLLPVFDGRVLPEDPYAALKSGNFNKDRLLWGYNTDEGSLFAPADTNVNQYMMLATQAYGYDKAQTVLKRFPVNADNPAFKRTRELLAYNLFTVGMKIYADTLSQQGLDVYGYNFDYASPKDAAAGLGARHAIEIPYAFNTLASVGLTAPEQQALADEMHTRWVNFIKTGNPNKGKVVPSSVNWPRYSSTHPEIIRFNTVVKVEALPHKDDIEFIERIVYEK